MENGSRQRVQRAAPHLESCPHVPVTSEDLAESGPATFTLVSQLLCYSVHARAVVATLKFTFIVEQKFFFFPSAEDVFTGCGTKSKSRNPLRSAVKTSIITTCLKDAPPLFNTPKFPAQIEGQTKLSFMGSVLFWLLSVKRPKKGCCRVEVADDTGGETGLGSVAG